MWQILIDSRHWHATISKIKLNNVRRLRDQPAANVCDGRIAFLSARTGLESLVIREPRNPHPI